MVRKLWLDGMWVPWLLKPFHVPLGFLFDFGLGHRKAIVWALIYLVAGGFMFNYAARRHMLVVDQNPVTIAFAQRSPTGAKGVISGQPATQKFADTELDASDVECGSTISPWIFALDSAIPFLDLREHQRCTIRTPVGDKTLDISLSYKTVKFPLWDISKKAWRYKALQIPTPKVSVVSKELFWRHVKATYTVIGWVLTSISILTFTGVLRRAAEQ